MLKKLITIGLITVAVIIAIILAVGLLSKKDDQYGWRTIVDSWHGITSSNSNSNSTQNQAESQTNSTSDSSTQSSTNPTNQSTPLSTSQPNSQTPSLNASTTPPSTTTKPSTSTSTTKPTPAPAPVPTPTPTCRSGGSCTATEVATHSSQSDCWVILGSKVYNITAFIPDHAGGKAVFTSSVCGHDITAYMNGSAAAAGQKHKHSTSAYNILNTYWYANLI